MQAVFGVAREKHNRLFYEEYENDKGALHFHSQIELYFVDEGEMEVTVNDRRRLLKGGEMSVALSFYPHAYKTPSSSRSGILIIPTYLCKDFLDEIKNKTVSSPFILEPDSVAEIRSYAKELGKEDMNPIKRSGFIHLVLGAVLENLTFDSSHKPSDTDLASRLLLYINETFKDDISLSRLSAHFGYSESYLSRYFKNSFDVGFNRYLNILRLKKAMTLISEKKHSITYCAMESGFSSMRSFYRIFGEEFGCSPKRWVERSDTRQP